LLENLKLRRSTYVLFIAWGIIAFFVASAIFKFQPLTVSFSINDRRLLSGLGRGILLLFDLHYFHDYSVQELQLSFPASFILDCLGPISGSS